MSNVCLASPEHITKLACTETSSRVILLLDVCCYMDREHGTIARKHKFREAAPLDAGQSTNLWWLPCHTKERLVISGGHGQISSRTTERLRTPPRGLDRSEPVREDTVRTSSRGGYSLSPSTQQRLPDQRNTLRALVSSVVLDLDRRRTEDF